VNSLYAPYARTIAWRALPRTVLGTRYFFRYSRWSRVVVPGLVSLALDPEGKRRGGLEGRGVAAAADGIGGSVPEVEPN
jgi:hypothetical protein